MNTKIILNYLSELSLNNYRDWYHAHKKEYKEANKQFEKLIQELIYGIGAFDPSVLKNIPNISDVHDLIETLTYLKLRPQ